MFWRTRLSHHCGRDIAPIRIRGLWDLGPVQGVAQGGRASTVRQDAGEHTLALGWLAGAGGEARSDSLGRWLIRLCPIWHRRLGGRRRRPETIAPGR